MNVSSEPLKQLLMANVNKKSDINEHLRTLAEYAARCATVCEMGVRGAVSTSAFAYGLAISGSDTKKLMCVDIASCPEVEKYFKLLKDFNVETSFTKADSATIEIPQVDLLFIDTWHCYGHLKRELAKHHTKVNKWIIMHDTEVDKLKGEDVRMGSVDRVMRRNPPYPQEEIEKGLWPAIEEFLSANSNWRIEKKFDNNNGLTILTRS